MDIVALRTDARYNVGPQIDSTKYPDTAVDRNLNFWYREVLGWIIPLRTEWEMQGEIMWIDGQINVTDYEIPSNLLRIYKIEAKLSNSASFVPCTPISVADKGNIAEGNTTRTEDDASFPTVEVFGDFIQIRPAFSENVVNGLKIWVQEDFADLTATPPYDVPNLMNPVRRALSLGAAMDYCASHEMWIKYRELKRRMYGDPNVKDDTGEKGKVIALYSNKPGQRRRGVSARRRTSYR